MTQLNWLIRLLEMHPDCAWSLRPISDDDLKAGGQNTVNYILEFEGANFFLSHHDLMMLALHQYGQGRDVNDSEEGVTVGVYTQVTVPRDDVVGYIAEGFKDYGAYPESRDELLDWVAELIEEDRPPHPTEQDEEWQRAAEAVRPLFTDFDKGIW